MKKIPFLLLFILLFSFSDVCSAIGKEGRARIDSLLSQLPLSTEDTNKVNLLNDLSHTYSFINADDALKYAKQALELANKLEWERGIAYSNLNLAYNYIILTDYSKALIDGQQNLIEFQKLGDKKGIALAHINVATAQLQFANYPDALENCLNALSLAEESGYQEGVAKTLSRIVWIYAYQSNFNEALELGFKSLKLNKKLGNKSGMAVSLNAIGSIYYESEDYPNSLKYWLRALKINQELGNTRRIGVELDNVGWSYYKISNFPMALKYLHESLIINKTMSPTGVAWDFIGIGGTYLAIAKDSSQKDLHELFEGNLKTALEQAKFYTDSAILLSEYNNHIESLIEGYQQLSEIQSLLGDYEGALANYQKHAQRKNDVYSSEKSSAIAGMRMKYDQEKIDVQKKAELEKQKLIRNVISVGLAFVLLFLLVVYRQRNKIAKEKKRSEELLLNILPEEIAEELKEKGKADAKDFDMVSIIFTDFKEFTQTSEKLSAQELVSEINTCFEAFDTMCGKYKIEKIKTIGDAYMAAGGLPVPTNDSVKNTLLAALEMQEFIVKRRIENQKQNKPAFEMRVGIHTGAVVAGIVGVKKFQYDIWGDTVNTASRIESESEAGKVNISQSTYDLIKNDPRFTFESRGKISAKGKGEMEMYFVSINSKSSK